MIVDDRRIIKILEIARTMELSHGIVETIIHDHLHMSKVSASWVLRNLTREDRLRRVTTSKELQSLFMSDPDKFVHHVVTCNEMWLNHWDPESMQESMQWRHATSPPPKKFKMQPFAAKVMATVFWTVQVCF